MPAVDVMLVELLQGDTRIVLCVEGGHSEDTEVIFVPERVSAQLDAEEYVQLNLLREMPPNATKIELQPLDSELYHCDIAGAVSQYLATWNVLQKHTTLSVPCEELGGYIVDIFVKNIEPADTVLLRGEVPLELAEPLIDVPEFTVPPAAAAAAPSATAPSFQEPEDTDFRSVIPMIQPQPLQPQQRQQPIASGGFKAFQCQGYRLGS